MGIKYDVNENFFKKWTPEMAYVLGYLYADGSLEDASYLRGKYLRVSSIEKESIIRIKELLASKHTVVKKPPTSKNGKVGYLLRIGSHILYADLVKLGLYPNKSLTIKFPNIPKNYMASFIRGYFDGDGCVMIQKTKGKRQDVIIKKLSTVFTSGSRDFLDKLAKELQKIIGTDQTNVYVGHNSYMLSYSTGDSIKIFKFIYGNGTKSVFIRRKFDIFCEYFRLKSQKEDSKVREIIKENK
jgi:hypothetical protein